jgi:hypothetical protein
MATTKASGSRRGTQHPPEALASENRQPPSRYVRIFTAIADLNREFDLLLADVERLKQFGFFRGEFSNRFAKTCRLTIEEMRAWAIFELTEALYTHAEEEWARFGRLLRDWENRFKDPNDILIDAERLKQKLQKEAGRKATGKKKAKGAVEKGAQ